MIRLQIRLFGPYFSSFSTNSYGYPSQMSQNLASNFRTFASARIIQQPPSVTHDGLSQLNGYKLGAINDLTSGIKQPPLTVNAKPRI